MDIKSKKIVCLGGGIGTVNLLKGLKKAYEDISVVVSTADEGGSGGRLRRLFKTSPPGDFVSCMSALAKNEELAKLLLYRFPGNRYGMDNEIGGHKLGNFILTALSNMKGNFQDGLSAMEDLFDIKGNIFPSTEEKTRIYAKTVDGEMVYGEENIDLGKYGGKRVLSKIYLNPKKTVTSEETINKIRNGDIVIAGPGDLYTTLLPVLMVPDICKELKRRTGRKIFIVNVANKPFETKGYKVSDYLKAINRHLGFDPFDTIIINNNFSVKIPGKYHYEYVRIDKESYREKTVETDLINKDFPLYHDSAKLAKAIDSAL